MKLSMPAKMLWLVILLDLGYVHVKIGQMGIYRQSNLETLNMQTATFPLFHWQ